MDDFRRFFLRGLAALVPTLLTLSIVVWAYRFVNDNVGAYITRGLLGLCSWISDEPAPGLIDPDRDSITYGTKIDEWDAQGRRLTIEFKAIHHGALSTGSETVRNEAKNARNRALWEIAFRKYRMHVLGFIVAIVLVYFTGFFLASFIGRASWRAAEGLLVKIPVIRAVYSNVKQVTDFLLSDRPLDFSGVVAIQYPRMGTWTVGLSTGGPLRRVQRECTEELITVFIPTSPTPFTGYIVQLPRREVIELNMTIDEGLRFVISGGVIKPGAPGSDLGPGNLEATV